MSDETRSPSEIERDLQREREDLQRTLDAISSKLSFDGAWNFLGRQLRTNKGSYSRDVTKLMAEKPFAVALTAIGVSWLFFGPSSVPRRNRERIEDQRSFRGYSEIEDAAARSRSFSSAERVRETRTTDPAYNSPSPVAANPVAGEGAASGRDVESRSVPRESTPTATRTDEKSVTETRPSTSGSAAPVPQAGDVHEPLVSTRAENPTPAPASTTASASETQPVSAPSVVPSKPEDDEENKDGDKKI